MNCAGKISSVYLDNKTDRTDVQCTYNATM